MLDYEGEDIGDVFGDLEWPTTEEWRERLVDGVPRGALLGCDKSPSGKSLPPENLSQETKAAYVQAYAEWWLCEKPGKQLRPLSEGFRAVIGGSRLLKTLVDAAQLEKILCGETVPVDIGAIRSGADVTSWDSPAEKAYLERFWAVLDGLSDSEKSQFLVFVTASDRMPLLGWKDLKIAVCKHGRGDDRLPTAHTCFRQLMLPHFTSEEVLRSKLLSAIKNSEGFVLL